MGRKKKKGKSIGDTSCTIKFMLHRTITLFGSSKVESEHPVYREAYDLGKMLAEMGYTVMSGGHAGIMEAASHGAVDAGGETIGVTCELLKKKYGVRKNDWVKTEIQTTKLTERMCILINRADAILVVAGGVGTVGEVGLAWAGMQGGEFVRKPFIFIGDEWKDAMQSFIAKMREYISDGDTDFLLFAKDNAQALKMLSTLK